jgi:hypothetical protein
METNMAKAIPSKRDKEAMLGELENLLASTFELVSPRPAYVKDLNRRLSNYPTPIPEISVPRIPREAVGIIVGVIGGTALIILGIRIMVPLIASLTALYGMRRDLQVEEASSTGFSDN